MSPPKVDLGPLFPQNWGNQNITSKLWQNRNRHLTALYRRPVATHSRPVGHHQCLPPWGYPFGPFPNFGKINMTSIGRVVGFPCSLPSYRPQCSTRVGRNEVHLISTKNSIGAYHFRLYGDKNFKS